MQSKTWFSFSCNDGIQFHETEAEAEAAAHSELEYERQSAGDDGWSDEVEHICWGKIGGRVAESTRETIDHPEHGQIDIIGYELVKVEQ